MYATLWPITTTLCVQDGGEDGPRASRRSTVMLTSTRQLLEDMEAELTAISETHVVACTPHFTDCKH